MKQYITKDNLSELNDNGKKSLFDWEQKTKQKQLDDELPGAVFVQWREDKNLPLLSIGQMIEFIEDIKPEWRGITLHHTPGGDMSFPGWMITQNYGVSTIISQHPFKEELCDALWEVIKEILNKARKVKK